jgi:C-terminal processing protease CtpA/Prc
VKEAGVLRAAIDTLSKSDSSKWIVDLRGVTGDDFRIQMAGLGPLLGEGLITSVVDQNERVEKMFEIHNGRFYEEQHLAVHFVCPPDLGKSNIAILIDETTAHAGEVLALAFRGRKFTKLFGSPTHGNVGIVKEINLGNDLVLSVTSRYYQDRRGNIYKDTVFPHIKVLQPENVSEDAFIAAAMQWLVVPDDHAVTASILKKNQ